MKRTLIISGIIIGIIAIIVVGLVTIFPIKYKNEIYKYSKKYKLPASLVASVINIESGYDRHAESKVGARGLMQILPTTGIECAERMKIDFDIDDLWEVGTNIEIGCYYLSYLLEIFNGNIINTLCSYNWGLGNVREHIASGNVDSDGTITNIPVEETRSYVKKYKVSCVVYKTIYRYD